MLQSTARSSAIGRSCASVEPMELEYREMHATARETPGSQALLEKLGIKLQPGMTVWVCVHDSLAVGHCAGELTATTAEIRFLKVIPGYEGLGIARRLLSLVADWLRTAGATRIWLAAPSDPLLRAYGVYRAVGWHPTGERTQNGDEILELCRQLEVPAPAADQPPLSRQVISAATVDPDLGCPYCACRRQMLARLSKRHLPWPAAGFPARRLQVINPP
jgi:GNAT superfamily N-acetyltransferase